MFNLSPPNISHILELPDEILQKIATDPSSTPFDRSSLRASCKTLRDVIDTTKLTNTVQKISSDSGQQTFYLIDGCVYAYGVNRLGQLGFNTEGQPVTTPTLIDPSYLQGQKIVEIISNGGSTFLRSENGDVFACGNNMYGQLGFNTGGASVTTLTLIDKSLFQGQAIVEIISNGRCTFFRLKDGRVCACGGNEHGQLGLGMESYTTELTLIDKSLFKGQAIVGIINNRYYTFLRSENSDVFVCGTNQGKQLGIDTQSLTVTTPTLIDKSLFQGQAIKKISSFLGPTNFLITFFQIEKDVFACGNNKYGQLGFNTGGAPVTIPTLIDSSLFEGQIIVEIISNGYCTFFLSENGDVFACGNNMYGQLGFNTGGASVTTPTLIDSSLFEGQAIVEIISNGCCTFFRLKDGRVCACGNNDHRQLGLGTQDEYITTPTLIDPSSFKNKIVKITNNGSHTFFYDEYGNIYACGDNTHRQLYIDTQDIYITTPILITHANSLSAVITARQQLLDQRETLKDLQPEGALNRNLSDILSHVSVRKTPEAILNALKMIRDELRITTQELPALPDQALITEASTELATGESIKKIIPNPLIFSGLNKTFEIIQARSSQARHNVL